MLKLDLRHQSETQLFLLVSGKWAQVLSLVYFDCGKLSLTHQKVFSDSNKNKICNLSDDEEMPVSLGDKLACESWSFVYEKRYVVN